MKLDESMATRLLDLTIHIAAPNPEAYRITYELLRRFPYPPVPQAKEDDVRLVSESERLARIRRRIPTAAFAQILTEAADWAHQPWSHPAEAWINKAAEILFDGEAGDLVWEMLDNTEPPDVWQAQRRLARVSLEIDGPALRDLPWERVELTGLWRRSMVLRRKQGLAGLYSRPFDFPLTVAVHKLAAPGPGWGDELFDGFTHATRHMGGFEWFETTDTPGTGEVHHIALGAGGPNLADLGAMLGLESGFIYTGPPLPRLLILHDLAARLTPRDVTRFINSGLRYYDAILAVAFDDPTPYTGGFFPTFYRKLMHNRPVDECLLTALRTALQNGALPRGWMLGAREEGEHQLLLTRPLVEAATALRPAGAKGVPSPAFGLPYAAPGARPDRIAADLQEKLRLAGQRVRETIAHHVEETAFLTFEDEGHSVTRILETRALMHGPAEDVEMSEEAMTSLANLSTEQVEDATKRVTNLWLTQTVDDAAAGEAPKPPLKASEPLIVQHSYLLHIQIGPPAEGTLQAGVFPDNVLDEIFKVTEDVVLDVVLFAPEEDFELETVRTRMTLPHVGPGQEVRIRLVPQTTGRRRLRVCIYYRNVLLQSAVLEATVIGTGAPLPEGPTHLAASVDYIASIDLTLLDELPQPTLALFTNQAQDGSHWIGLYDGGPTLDDSFQNMMTLDPDALAATARKIRQQLFRVEGGEANRYRFDKPVPLSDQERAWRAGDVVTLAREGWILYDALFWGQESMDTDHLFDFEDRFHKPGIVSVARCRGMSTTFPWASLYSLPLDTSEQAPVHLCPIFLGHVASNQWSDDGRTLVEVHDLLDEPMTCRAQSECPLNDPAHAELNVCPFGFWGFQHQIGQPLQYITPTPVGEMPEEFRDGDLTQTSFILHRTPDKVRIAVGANPTIPDAVEHREEVTALVPAASLEVDWEEARDQVLELLAQGGRQIYYFYCHGRLEDDRFHLEVGPSDRGAAIRAADLNPRKIRWTQQPQPLVVLNCCESVAMTPEIIHGFLTKLRRLGAAGVVGTEIEVFSPLARAFGRQVLQGLLDGQSAGEAFIAARRYFLRQLNPMGLAFTLHAPATLHLHDPGGCAWCAAHT